LCREGEIPGMDGRICAQCKIEKTAAHFTRRSPWPPSKRKRPKKPRPRCHECQRRNYKENPELARKRAREYYWRNRETVLAKDKVRRKASTARTLLNAAKGRARRKGLPFDLTVHDIVIPSHCPVLGLPFVVNTVKCGSDSPTLDRIIGHLGYVRGNIVVVSFRVNTIKSDATPTELRAVADFYDRLASAAAETVTATASADQTSPDTP
jgi:hypothetical protein